ncbi:hypothetical protein [Zoogloea sp.]|uniref:hypothetical protein n=1 Tax=Zoogloea sp. TaxID=49181 RepID=UPI0035AEC8CB
MEMTNSAVGTPAAEWRQAGEPDPHAGRYDCERAKLTMGHLTDDELANGAFMNYDQPLNVQGILSGTHVSPIAWMTAVKDRIRWLSRSLEQAKAERDAMAAKLAELEGQTVNLLSTCHRLALELECLLLDTKDSAPVSRWWDSAMVELDEWHKAKDSVSARPAPAEVHQAVLLTDEDFCQGIEGAGIPVEDVALACAIKDLVQTAVLERNGLKPQAKGD